MKRQKRIHKIWLMNLTALLCLATNSTAGNDSHSIPVSCSIPEVPDLNAPLIREESSTTIEFGEKEKDIQEETSLQLPLPLLQQETKHNLYTFYAR